MATTYGVKNPYLLALLQQSNQPVKSHQQGLSNMAHALLAGLEQGDMDKLAAQDRTTAAADKAFERDLALQKFGLQQREFGLKERELQQNEGAAAERARVYGGPSAAAMPSGPMPPENAPLPSTPVLQSGEQINGPVEVSSQSAAPSQQLAPQAVQQPSAQRPPLPLHIQGYLYSRYRQNQEQGAKMAAEFYAAHDKRQADLAQKDAEERQKMERQREAARPGQQAASSIIIQDINRALDIGRDHNISGLWGSASSWVPGSPSHNAYKLLQGIKANIGFQQLQEMRNSSPTGGALGQVTLPEIQFLQSAYGNVEQSQDQKQLMANLRRVRQIFLNVKEGRHAWDNGDGSSPSAEQPQPSQGNTTKSGVRWSVQ